MMKKTAQMLAAKAEVARQEITEEAQKLFDLYNDPKVPAEEKETVKREIEGMIRRLEERAETNRHVRGGG